MIPYQRPVNWILLLSSALAIAVIIGANLTDEHSQFSRKFFSQFWGNFPNDGLANEPPAGHRPSISFEKEFLHILTFSDPHFLGKSGHF